MTITFGQEFLVAIIANILVIIAGVVRIENKLTRIETEIKWIKSRCPKCQLTSEDHLK